MKVSAAYLKGFLKKPPKFKQTANNLHIRVGQDKVKKVHVFFRWTLNGLEGCPKLGTITAGTPQTDIQLIVQQYLTLQNYYNRGYNPDEVEAIERKAQRDRDVALTDRATVHALFTDYLESHLKQNSSLITYKQELGRYTNHIKPLLGNRIAEDVRRSDLQAIVDRLVQGGNKEQGRYVGELLPRVWRWGFNRNPDVYPLNVEVAARLQKPQKENRQRYATEKEIKVILKYGSPVIKGCLYMGQRTNETYRMEYADLVDGSKNWIEIPPEKMKQKRRHRVYVTKTVWELIKQHRSGARTVNDRWCWCGYGSGRGGHISNAHINGEWVEMGERLAKVKRPDAKKLQMRDLRRTLYTWILENLKEDQTATAVAGHKRDGMGNIYGVYDYEDEKKNAMLAWEKYLNGLIKK